MNTTPLYLLELLASLFGFANIYLAARLSNWNWLFGMLMVSLYAIIFYQVELYANMGLQFVFFCQQIYGLYRWHYATHTDTPVKLANGHVFIATFAIGIPLFALMTFILDRYTHSNTIYLDALVATLSLLAQWMMSRKWLENWWVWMLVNAIAIILYLSKDLYFTSILYGFFFFFCIVGYRSWKQKANLKFLFS